MSQETREQRRAILMSAVDQYLDHLEDDFDRNSFYGDATIGAVVICGEVHTSVEEDETVIPTYWASNENKIWHRGFFELLSDYTTIPPSSIVGGDE